MSVVICTLGEDVRLRPAVESVLAQNHTDLELIVVDNAPESQRVARLLEGCHDPRLRTVAEHRRGLSVARNTGVASARGRIVAFTDDDAVADPGWVRALVDPFADHPEVECVTGLVLPAALETRAQLWFEEFGAFDKGYRRLVWSAGPAGSAEALGPSGRGGVLFPYSAGVFGSGNNMAFRVGFLNKVGGFDPALGAGTLARGGEDLDAFLLVMLTGGVLVYEPQALVRHYARADFAGLRAQMYGYGAGMCAVITKHLAAGPASALRILVRVPAGLRRLLDPGSEKNQDRTAQFPAELRRAELRGYLSGPWLYLRSRRAARRSRPNPVRLPGRALEG